MLALFLMLLVTYYTVYALNYAGIIGLSLIPVSEKDCHSLKFAQNLHQFECINLLLFKA